MIVFITLQGVNESVNLKPAAVCGVWCDCVCAHTVLRSAVCRFLFILARSSFIREETNSTKQLYRKPPF